MTNEIVRGITGDGLVKAVAVTGRGVVERARNIHKLLPMGTAALGRALMGASMMGDMLKEERGAVTLQIKGVFSTRAMSGAMSKTHRWS